MPRILRVFIEDNANLCWNHLKTQINATLDIIRATGRDNDTSGKTKSWIAVDTWKLIRNCKEQRMKGLQCPEVRKKYFELWKEVKKNRRKDKNNFLSNICVEIENDFLKFQTSYLSKKVRLISRQFKPKTWVINDEDGNSIHDLDVIAERWRGYCERLYDQQPDASLESCPNWNNLEPEPPILRSEITAAIAALKCKKAPGPDQITA